MIRPATGLMESSIAALGAVPLAEFTGERVYMRPFLKREGLPADLRRWQPTVDAMLDGVDTELPIFLMVDQRQVRAGDTHRRGGVHIDGHWIPDMRAHSYSGGHGSPSRSGHDYVPPEAPKTPVKRKPAVVEHHQDPRDVPSTHYDTEFAPLHQDEAIILASDITACRGWIGTFDGLGSGGDCSHVDVSRMRELEFTAGRAFAGNVSMLHESIAVPADCLRTVVRLNVPGWAP